MIFILKHSQFLLCPSILQGQTIEHLALSTKHEALKNEGMRGDF